MMTKDTDFLRGFPLPDHWSSRVKRASVNILALAQSMFTYTREWNGNSPNDRIRLRSQCEQSQREIALLQEELRLITARMARIPASQRPQYLADERMAALNLRAARGWSQNATARHLLVEPETISRWMKRLDEPGEDALVRIKAPPNKYPQYVRFMVQQLRQLCPFMGKTNIAQALARLGLHPSVNTVGRILKEPPHLPPREDPSPEPPANPPPAPGEPAGKKRIVTARYPHHVWHIDLTVVTNGCGLWVPWYPFSQLQVWPFCWWVAVIVDQFTRRVVDLAVFRMQPDSFDMRYFLLRAFQKAGRPPRHLISDKGGQFWCDGFKRWCREHGVRNRFGAVGQYGSIAIVERFIRSMKEQWTHRTLPIIKPSLEAHLWRYGTWYNRYRPHQGLGGKTPDEMAAKDRSITIRLEPRPSWPLSLADGDPPAIRLVKPARLIMTPFEGEKLLPVLELKLAA